MRWRHMAERLTHRVVLRRRLPDPFPRLPFYVSSEGGLRYLRPSLHDVDPTLLRTALRCVRPGQVVWDVGANVGLFSVAAAALAGSGGRVFAMEPDTWLVSLLRKTAASAGPRAPIEVLPIAVCDENGLAGFNIAKRSRSTSFLDGFGSTQTGGMRSHETVATMTLDRLLDFRPAPDFLKVDVEGAEVLVLRGAERVLRLGVTLLIEVGTEHSVEVAQLLCSHGYRFFDAEHADFPECELPPYSTLAATDLLRIGKK
jgi:FkbM family methyltransferase